MKDSQNFKKILLLLFLSALVLIALHYFMYGDIKKKNESISSLQYDLSTKASKQDYLIATERSLDKFAVEIAHAQDSAVPKEEEIKFIEKIESIAKNNGLAIEIKSLILKNEELPSLDLTILKVQTKTTGSWKGTYMFIAEIESLPVKLKIGRTSMILIEAGKAQTPSVWSNDIDISVLKYK